MNVAEMLNLAKAKLGITTMARDTFLTAIIDSVIDELVNEKGLALDSTSPNHLMFVVDYAVWRYQNRDGNTGLPRHLQFRLHSLYINSRGEQDDL